MTPHKQLFRHNPSEGLYGDCYRAAIACLLDKHPTDVPHVYSEQGTTGDEGVAQMRSWLARRGLDLVEIPLVGDRDLVLQAWGNLNRDRYALLCGKSSRGTSHVVIIKGARIVHDTSLDNVGVVAPFDAGYYLLVLIVPGFMCAASEPRAVACG